MSLDQELEAFWAEEPPTVIDDAEVFKARLQIGAEAFKVLSAAENLGSVMSVVGGAGLLSTGAAVAWFSSLGVMGQIGLMVGAVSTPVGWIGLAGVGGAVATYGTRKALKSARGEAVIEVPKYIRTPIDMLALMLFNLMAAVALKIAHSDGEYCVQEREAIERYLVRGWGFNPTFIATNLKRVQLGLDSFSYDQLAEKLKECEKKGDIKYDSMVEEIIGFAKGVTNADGIVHDAEKVELNALTNALRKKSVLDRFFH
jgi:tellurite resistance protein